jgi:excinuclease ABC subunit C
LIGIEAAAPLPIPPPQGGKEQPGGVEGQTAGPEIADSADSPWPDLVLIDGGLGQLNAARETLGELGLRDVPLIAIAKGPERDAGRETFFMSGREPFRLKPRDAVLYFVERLRDEAHRFAVEYHRKKRARRALASPLDDVPGIGPTRKKALLRRFGSLARLRAASEGEIRQTPGIGPEMAKVIYEALHEVPGRERPARRVSA